MRCAPYGPCRPFATPFDLHLVESSESLRAEQAALLVDAHPIWHEGFETVPPGPLLVIANEFFDALPIQQFERVGNAWQERVVTFAPSSHALRFTATDLVPVEAGLGCAPSGAIVERAPMRAMQLRLFLPSELRTERRRSAHR